MSRRDLALAVGAGNTGTTRLEPVLSATPEAQPEAPALSDDDRRILERFHALDLRAHLAGVALSELSEQRRQLWKDLQAAKQDLASMPDRPQVSTPNMPRAWPPEVGREELNRFVRASDTQQFDQQQRARRRAGRVVAVIELRLRLTDDEIVARRGAVGPLRAQAEAIGKHLQEKGILS